MEEEMRSKVWDILIAVDFEGLTLEEAGAQFVALLKERNAEEVSLPL